MKLKSDNNLTSNALLGAAFLFAVPALRDWTFHGPTFDTFDQVTIGGCVFLLLMAIWARFVPLPPAAISLLLYLAFFAWLFGPIVVAGKMRLVDWVISAAICTLLVTSLFAATGKAATSFPSRRDASN